MILKVIGSEDGLEEEALDKAGESKGVEVEGTSWRVGGEDARLEPAAGMADVDLSSLKGSSLITEGFFSKGEAGLRLKSKMAWAVLMSSMFLCCRYGDVRG